MFNPTLVSILLVALAAPAAAAVDPRIGVLGDGANVIGPSLPFGSIHPSPDTPDGSHDGYHPERPIRGFSQLHASGTGWGQYGNFLVSPQVGLATLPSAHDSPKEDEKAEAHQYRVRLARYGVLAEVTPAHRSAIYRFTFPQSDQAHVVLDATHHIPGDIVPAMMGQHSKPIPSSVQISDDGRSVSGSSTFTGGFGGPYKLHFYAQFDRVPAAAGTWRNEQIQSGARTIDSSGQREAMGAFVRFDTRESAVVQMKIAVSFHSIDQARASLQAEIPHWDYAKVRDAAQQRWADALAAIDVRGGSPAERTIFQTALFHAHVMPRQRRAEFARFSPTAPMWDDHYANWDTWRTLYPLLGMIRPDVVRDTVNSFVERQRVDGMVSDTFIAGTNRFGEQGGNAVDMIIADARARNIAGIDWKGAWGVMKHNADQRRTGPHFDNLAKGKGPYLDQGWIPAGTMSTSMTLEYAYNDFAAAVVGASLGHREDARRYLERSRQWGSLWNPETESDGFKGFIMPRNADLSWVEFDTKVYPGSWKPYFYESNAWTYSYFAPHQVARLVALMGGRERFIARLEYAFEKELIDVFNEPSFLVPQLFHYVGRPDLSAKWMNRILGEKFTLRGYPGDDDSGAMSSYYVWGRLGLFPNAGQEIYFLNGPAFERASVRRPGQGPLVIRRSGKGIYVAAARLNGKPLQRSWVRHAELAGKATLEFRMSETPTAWAAKTPAPPSLP